MIKQKVITVYLNAAPGEMQSLDKITQQLNNNGWKIVQISNAFGNRGLTNQLFPTVAVTILAEKEA